MTEITWDATGERRYETGVDHGVLYVRDTDGDYDEGVAWNGLTTVTESPSGAEATPQYADNIKYLNLVSAEQFGGTIEAFTYPPEFEVCDGTAKANGILVGQQGRKTFGLCYRSLIGNDVDGQDHGYKLHLAYGCLAAPSEKAYSTVNDSPEALALSWEFSTTPVLVDGLKPTALLTIPSTEVDVDVLSDLEDILYGRTGSDPRLPLPDEVIDLFDGSVTEVDLGTPANQPTYNAGTHVVTLPAVSGVQWKINGINKASGAQPALAVGQTARVTANPTAGHSLTGDNDWTYNY